MKRLYALTIIALASVISAIAQNYTPYVPPISTPEPHSTFWQKLITYCIIAAIIGAITKGIGSIKEHIQDRRSRRTPLPPKPEYKPYDSYYNANHEKVIIMPPSKSDSEDKKTNDKEAD